MKKVFLTTLWIAAAAFVFAQNKSFKPGELWPDNKGCTSTPTAEAFYSMTAHITGFGEFKTAGQGGNTAQVGVSCYSSKDLYRWKNEGIVMRVEDDPSSEIAKGCVIERPKVVYNAKTKKFVLWFHLELKGQGYGAARTAVAVSDKVTGPYTFVRSYRPNADTWPVNFPEGWKTKTTNSDDLKWWTDEWRKEVTEGLFIRRDFNKGQMSRDMTVFVDDDGKAYHIHSSEENLTIHISELTNDYLSFTGKWATSPLLVTMKHLPS